MRELRVLALVPLGAGVVKASELVSQGHIVEGVTVAVGSVVVALVIAGGGNLVTRWVPLKTDKDEQ